MSTTNELGDKILLPRLKPDGVWDTLASQYASRDSRRWKCLAMVVLHESAGWPLHHIGRVFGHHKGHVSRLIDKTKNELRELFADGRVEE